MGCPTISLTSQPSQIQKFKCSLPMTYKKWAGHIELSVNYYLSHFAISLCSHLSLFLIRPISLPSLLKAGRFVLISCSLGFPHSRHLISNDLSILPTLCRSFLLFQCLLSAVSVVFVVVVLSLCLLVTEEVAPPAFRVVHLSGRPSALHPLHLLRHNIKWGTN